MILPEKFEERMKEMLGEEYGDFLEVFTKGERYEGVRINPTKVCELPDITNSIQRVPWCKDGYYIDKSRINGNHPYHIGGLLYFQEPSAMCVVEALKPKKGDFVLDLCGAPGGKTTQAAALIGDEGLMIANEVVPKRASVLAENVQRFGLKNTVVLSEYPEKLEKRFPEFFDKIIVDAPCSGEGMFRKEAAAIPEWSIEHTQSCAIRQKNILDSAIKMLKKGGLLVYSTCTFAPVENEGVCDYILSTYPDMTMMKIDLPGLTPAEGKFVNSSFDLRSAKRIFPHKVKGEGHFVALFKKEGEGAKGELHKFKEDKGATAAGEMYRNFEKEFLKTKLFGTFALFGENLYLVPKGISFDKLKVALPGLYLGVCKKGRFEPSHALALALRRQDFDRYVTFGTESRELKKYLHGEAVPGEEIGWCAVCFEEYPIGWVKGSGGILKNHFPKHLRI